MSEFEVYLVSNGSMSMYPDNKMSSFTNQFTEPIVLEDDWEVALSEISFPTNVNNISGCKIRIMQHIRTEENSEEHKAVEYNFPAGLYRTAHVIVTTINERIGSQFEYSERDNKLSLTLPKDVIRIQFSSADITNILGIASTEHFDRFQPTYQIGSKIIGTYPVDLVHGTSMLYLYLDIVDFNNIADTKAPILRIIDIPRIIKDGQLQITPNVIQRLEFTTLQFKKVLRASLSSIKAELRTETGQLVPFAGTGSVILTLKFRRVSK